MAYYLGIKVKQQEDGIFISQESYAKEILKKSKVNGCNSISTRVEYKVKLSKEAIDIMGVSDKGIGPCRAKKANLSFDLPLRWFREKAIHGFREKAIHGHLFACAGNVAKLTKNEYQNFSLPKFLESTRSSIGAGIVFPTNLFRLEDLSFFGLISDVWQPLEFDKKPINFRYGVGQNWLYFIMHKVRISGLTFLVEVGLYESKEEAAKREEVLGQFEFVICIALSE
ncbi:hypothetical protein WN944_024173 [Citrus x changshan-huyou]|uniref:Mitochondrial protein n=1 Tax=Citrus x changshan-huyou TaxID=2935761 RepID=A0AAP0LN63_9ROSI